VDKQKKADPVGIGLLKEGDDACFLFSSPPADWPGWRVPGTDFSERPIMCFHYL